jgi:hypothetical protein
MNKLEEKWENDWNEKYQLCKEYKEQFGDIDIPKRYFLYKDGKKYNLGAWLSSQKEMYFGKGKRKYNQEHVDKLKKLGINWTIDYNKNNVSFPEMAIYYYLSKYFNIKKYKENNIEIDIFLNDFNIGIEYDGCAWHDKDRDLKKNAYCADNNIKLYRIREFGCEELNDSSMDYYYNRNNINELEKAIGWICRQLNLKDVDIDIKRDTNIIYNIQKNALTQPWKEKYAICKKYYEENGDINFPRSTIIDGVKIGMWLSDQRKKYKRGLITREQIQALESLNILWGDVDEYNWNKKFKLLVEYKAIHGTPNPIGSHVIFKGVDISSFANHEKEKYFQKSKGRYNQEHIDRLNAIGFVWDCKYSQWLEKYNVAKGYYEKHGNINIPYNTIVDGVKIGIWISKQRKDYRNFNTSKANPQFTRQKIELLNDLNMDWN